MLTDFEEDRLERFLIKQSAIVPLEREYWLRYSADEGASYCYDCAEKEIEKLNDPDISLGGGYDIFDSDSVPFCEICEIRLECRLTECGINDEIDHFKECKLNPYSAYDCLDFLTMIQSADWHQGAFMEMQGCEVLLKLCRDVLDTHFWILPYEDFRHMWG